MRPLVVDPRRVPAGLYRRFVRRAQLRGQLSDHLVRGEPYLALNALVLDRDEAALLRDLTATFAAAIHRLGQVVAGDVPAMEELGFPWVAAELLGAETPRLPLVGRFDFARDGAGRWWLLEFNADTPSGVREAIEAEGALRELLPEARPPLGAAGEGLRLALIRAFRESVADLPRDGALGLVTDAGELEDLSQMAYTARLIREPLAALGVPVVLGDVANLRARRAGLSLRGQPLGAVYRYVPFETTFGTPAFAALAEASASGRVRLLNGLYGLLLQHKGLLARLWRQRDDPRFPPAERVAIRDHLPATWSIRDAGVGGRVSGVREGTGDAPLSDTRHPTPDTCVVKQVFGREGEEVYFGEDLDDNAWEALRARGTYVVQRRVEIQAVPAVVPTSEGPRVERGYATVGCFAVDGAWAGFYTRFGGKITTSRAKWLATLVEPER